jgi:hypothetical protein
VDLSGLSLPATGAVMATDCAGAQYAADTAPAAAVDACEVCNGDGSTCTDCKGVPNGGAAEDECGVCDEAAANDCALDCHGVWGGADVTDECEVCYTCTSL